jgi:hypothetical protein
LNNRDWATLIWLGVLLVFALWHSGVRSGVWQLLRNLAHPKLLIPILAMLDCVSFLVIAGSRLGLWHRDLLMDTVVWTIVGALGLFFSVTQVATDQHFFRQSALRAIKFSVLLEFYVGLVVFSLPVELVLIPCVTLLVLMSLVAGSERRAKQAIDFVISMIGWAMLIYVTVRLATTWNQIDESHELRVLALPIWMTFSLLPFIFVLSLYMGYDAAFSRIRSATESKPARRRGRLALLLGLHLRTRTVNNFALHWARRLTDAASLVEARRVVREFVAASRSD